MEGCSVMQEIKVSLEGDRRMLTLIDRSSYKWKREYITSGPQ